MSQQSSPFLHQESKQDWRSFVAWDRYRQHETYAERIIPSEYAQRLKIETFRYRWYQRNGTLGRALGVIREHWVPIVLWTASVLMWASSLFTLVTRFL